VIARTWLVVAVAALAVAAGWWWGARTPPEPDGSVPFRDTGHPILLLVDASAITGSRPPGSRAPWPDLEWTNILEQGFGGCDVGDARGSGVGLDERQLVVVPRRTGTALTEPMIARLGEAVQSGANVLFEAPDSSLCRNLGLELAAVERRPRLPWPRPVVSSGGATLSLHPRPIAVPWTRLRYAPSPSRPEARPRVHASLDGRPLGWAKVSGQGAWLALGMDFAELSRRMRMGELPATTHDGWLDAWIEGICGASLTAIPIPRLATTPSNADGWLVAPVPRPASSDDPTFHAAGSPFRPVLGSGRRANAFVLPSVPVGSPDGIDPTTLDLWMRSNAHGGATALRFTFETATDSSSLASLAEAHEHLPTTESELLAWWTARARVRLRSRPTADGVVISIDEVPPSTPGLALQVPVRWRDASLAGWEANWGMISGRKAQRFDRVYRLIPLEPGTEGSEILLRYR
jgi:hypothetical protein